MSAARGDAWACLVKGGALVAAAEVEERFRRIKHWAGARSVLKRLDAER